VTLPSWALKALSGAPPNSAFHTKGVLGTRHAPLSRALRLSGPPNPAFRGLTRHLDRPKIPAVDVEHLNADHCCNVKATIAVERHPVSASRNLLLRG
jgi:hypothetical protein